MNKNSGASLKQQAREMMIAGESFNSIMEKTNLRLKDLKRIQHEINTHF